MFKHVIDEEYLIFRDADARLAKNIFKNGFSHVQVLKRTDYGWIEIDPTWCQNKVKVLPFSVKDDVVSAYKKIHQAHALKITNHVKKDKYNYVRFLCCVGSAQYVVNIRLFAISPYHLYKRLLKNKLAIEV